MKRTTCKKIKQLAATALIAITACSTAFAGTWQSDIFGWHYMQDDGSLAMGGWLSDGGTYYYMDAVGNMQTGWVQDVDGNFYYMDTALTGIEGAMHTGWVYDNGFWYFLDTRAGAPQGSRVTGWQWIDGYCYYFDPLLGGAMATSTITTDGYLLDANGRWTDGSGYPCYEEGRGISTVSTDTTSYDSSYYESDYYDYSIYDDDDSVSYSANDFTEGNYSMMTTSERKEMDEAISEFKREYITSGMSDFEKEIMIIEWICDTCSYKVGKGWTNATAYSCLVNGEAQCAGYADAFLQAAKACGLTARYVHNSNHAWNLIKLDGDWYHVDVTWEDDTGCGFGYLRNQYINLEDGKIRTISFHRTWSPSSTKCNGIAYGPNVVAEYLATGRIDTSLGVSYSDQEQEYFDGFNDADGLVFTYSNVDSAVQQIVSYLSERMGAKKTGSKILIHFPDSYKSTGSSDNQKVIDALFEIQREVPLQINAAYGDVLNNDFSIYFYKKIDSNGQYYAYATPNYHFKTVLTSVNYIIHYIDQDGNEVGAQSGKADNGEYISLNIPDGYYALSTSKNACTIRSGVITYDGSRIGVTGVQPVDMDVPVKAYIRNTVNDSVNDTIKPDTSTTVKPDTSTTIKPDTSTTVKPDTSTTTETTEKAADQDVKEDNEKVTEHSDKQVEETVDEQTEEQPDNQIEDQTDEKDEKQFEAQHEVSVEKLTGESDKKQDKEVKEELD